MRKNLGNKDGAVRAFLQLEEEGLGKTFVIGSTKGTAQVMYHKVREYFVYRDGHGLGSMAIHLAHHCFSFNIRWI